MLSSITATIEIPIAREQRDVKGLPRRSVGLEDDFMQDDDATHSNSCVVSRSTFMPDRMHRAIQVKTAL